MPDFGNAGLKRGSREWLFAMRCYYASDADVVHLCCMIETEWDREEERKKHETAIDEAAGREDEWSSGG